jgi:putative endonuclease
MSIKPSLFFFCAMPHFVYILFSDTKFKYYCGTAGDVETRLAKHNSKATPSTRHGIPWRVVRIVECETKRAALQLEVRVKKRGIERWLADHP